MSSRREMRNLALIGFMGTGKTTVGRLVARQLLFDFVDTDALIELRMGKRISEVFAQEGEVWFRDYERRLLVELEHLHDTVLATGGGLAASVANLTSLKQHALVVCLWASPEVIWQRVRRHTSRPLLQIPDPEAKIRQLLAERAPYYRQADILISTGQRSLRRVAQMILHEFRLVRPNPIPHETGDSPARP